MSEMRLNIRETFVYAPLGVAAAPSVFTSLSLPGVPASRICVPHSEIDLVNVVVIGLGATGGVAVLALARGHKDRCARSGQLDAAQPIQA